MRRRSQTMMPYYRFGGETYPYEANWRGRPWPGARAATTRGLGDVTKPGFIVVPPSDDPYLLHKQNYEHAPQFDIPASEDPYLLHVREQAQLEAGLGPTGAFSLSSSEKQAAIVLGAAAAAWFLFLKKGAPARKLIGGRRR